MVRINLIPPRMLSDQHLIAEMNEIGMLFGYVRKYPKKEEIKKEFTLNNGHIKFFKNKLGYLKKRYEEIQKEMKKRGFNPKKKLDYSVYNEWHMGQWKPRRKDYNIIIERISERLREKPEWYRYRGKYIKKEGIEEIIKQMEGLMLK